MVVCSFVIGKQKWGSPHAKKSLGEVRWYLATPWCVAYCIFYRQNKRPGVTCYQSTLNLKYGKCFAEIVRVYFARLKYTKESV